MGSDALGVAGIMPLPKNAQNRTEEATSTPRVGEPACLHRYNGNVDHGWCGFDAEIRQSHSNRGGIELDGRPARNPTA